MKVRELVNVIDRDDFVHLKTEIYGLTFSCYLSIELITSKPGLMNCFVKRVYTDDGDLYIEIERDA